MKNAIAFFLVLLNGSVFCQETIVSGDYDSELKLAFNPNTQKITGFYENATGENSQFSCVFYLEGTVTGESFKIQTYFPNDQMNDLIEGTMQCSKTKIITLQLPEEHGGCWNVQHFADEPVPFTLQKETDWIQISFVVNEKVHFYSQKNEGKKRKAYVVKNDMVFIEKIEDGWAYCSYFGKTTTKGWLKITDLNQP